MDRDCFEACVTDQRAPALRPGRIVVADKLSSHRSTRAPGLLRAEGNDLIFPAPCSSDLNPVGMAVSKPTTLPRKATARTCQALWKKVGAAVLGDRPKPQRSPV